MRKGIKMDLCEGSLLRTDEGAITGVIFLWHKLLQVICSLFFSVSPRPKNMAGHGYGYICVREQT